jgi:hypothetical protein
LLHSRAPRNARGSYGRLEIRVVLRASDRQPFLRTSSHKRVGTSEALSRTHVDAQSASLICGRYWRLFPSDGLSGGYSRRARLLLDHASRPTASGSVRRRKAALSKTAPGWRRYKMATTRLDPRLRRFSGDESPISEAEKRPAQCGPTLSKVESMATPHSLTSAPQRPLRFINRCRVTLIWI